MSNLKHHLKKIEFLHKIYPIYVSTKGRLRFLYNKHFTKTLSEEDLIVQFSKIGIFPKDKIVIDCAMSKIGMLENGAKTLVNALKRYITPEGLIVMPTFPHRGMYEYLENYEIFDVRTTPSKNGTLTETFRKSDGVFRSIHPTHPLAAWGKNAQTLMNGHEKSKSMYDEHSPYKKLLDLNVKNFCIGVNFDHMILIRIVDDLYKDYPINPYIEDKIYQVKVLGYNGEQIDIQTVCHDPDYFSNERDNMKLFPYMKDKIVFGHLGKAYTWVLQAQDMFDIQVDLAKKGIFPFRKLRFKKDYKKC